MKKTILIIFIQLATYSKFLPTNIETPNDKMNLLYLEMNKKIAKKTIKQFKKTFKKQASAKGGKISINDVWWSTTFNAYAMKYGPIWKITVHGGLLKHNELTQDVLNLVLCHELGHFLGGAPKFDIVGKKFSSYEGQADYWTAQRCLKEVFKNDNNVAVTNAMNIPNTVAEKCDYAYDSIETKALCNRVTMAGLSMAKLVSEITGKAQATIDTPDPTVVGKTYKDHPNFQCRVDTYFQASLCPATEQISDTDETKGTCYNQAIGNRPECWYLTKKQ